MLSRVIAQASSALSWVQTYITAACAALLQAQQRWGSCDGL